MATGIFLLFASGSAHADICSSVIPGAQMGPSPNFNSWPWTNACYISWPGTDSRDYSRNPRLEYERQCKATAGFLHFEGDFGSNRNTCIFEAPQQSEPAPSPEPSPQKEVSRPESPPERLPSFGDSDYDTERVLRPNGAPAVTNLFVAQMDQADGDKFFSQGRYYQAYSAFGHVLGQFSNQDRDVKTRSAQAEQLISYAKCMKHIARALSYPNGAEEEARYAAEVCPRATGRNVQDGIARLNAALGRPAVADVAAAPKKQAAVEAVDSQCLVVRAPRNTGVGCAKGKTWLMTFVDVSQRRELTCPSTVRFLFSDEEGPQKNEAPVTLQTCGTPPWNIRPAP